jgi:dTDP-4-amino-4,6-dideoxygalactose transaminase
MSQRIKFAHVAPLTDDEFEDIAIAFRLALLSGQYIGGHRIERFEQEWADYVGARYCIGVASGFHALKIALRSLAAGSHSLHSRRMSVAIPANTCAPTFAAVVDAGDCYEIETIVPDAWPVLTEGDHRQIWDVSPDVLIRVHLYGIISDCAPNVPYMIDDACQAHGAFYRQIPPDKRAHAAAWSFYPTKNLGAIGDAGAITTDIPSVAAAARGLSDYRNRDGINARLDPVQAAILSVRLPYLDAQNERRAQNAAFYNRRLRTLNDQAARPLLPDAFSGICGQTNWHQYVIRCVFDERDRLREYLRERKVETMIHYPEPGCAYIGEYPFRAKVISDCVLSLPVGPHLTTDQTATVANLIIEFYRSMEENE